MRVIGFILASGLLCLPVLRGVTYDPSQGSPPVRVGPGVTAPKVVRRVEPQYTREALDARIQGTAVLELVVDETGKPAEVSLLSPLGFGLDEKAQEAIESWRFEPGRKEGVPVRVLGLVEVNFRLSGLPYDRRAEERRTKYNLAVLALKGPSGPRRDSAVKTIQDLAKQELPAAMYALATLLQTGDSLAPDRETASALIRKAADKNYGPALFELGLTYRQSAQAPEDPEKGLRLIRDAALLGSVQAQLYLGDLHESGTGVPADPERARRYYGLCASRENPECQVRLARLLLALPNRRERDYLQAIAWIQLAADRGNPAARALAEKESPQLTSEQVEWVDRLKVQLVHRQ